LVLERVGPLAFTLSLQNAGAHLAFPTRDAPSLPVALGGLGISLSDIAMLYAGIAEGGQAQALRVIADAPDCAEASAVWSRRSLVSARHIGWRGAAGRLGDGAGAAGQAHHRLQDRHVLRFPRCLVGGFLNDYTVAVWVGHADGTPARSHGREAGAPILLKMFGLLPPDRRPAPPVPAVHYWCAPPDELPPSLRVFIATAPSRRIPCKKRNCRRPPSPFLPMARWCRCRMIKRKWS